MNKTDKKKQPKKKIFQSQFSRKDIMDVYVEDQQTSTCTSRKDWGSIMESIERGDFDKDTFK